MSVIPTGKHFTPHQQALRSIILKLLIQKYCYIAEESEKRLNVYRYLSVDTGSILEFVMNLT